MPTGDKTMKASAGDGHDPSEVMAEVHVSDSRADPKTCIAPEPGSPCSIVILGASGDLTARKLIPALFDLFVNNRLPQPFLIVGCARTDWDDNVFRDQMETALREAGKFEATAWGSFATALSYRQLEYDDQQAYHDLAGSLNRLGTEFRTEGNRLFYIALPPTLYQKVANRLGRAKLNIENQNGNGWSRIVVEKPFGTDLETAMDLDRRLHQYFQEHQIFRIDHYLAKETVQNVLMFRFANSLFEPLWNRRYVDYVTIRATETLGVGHRAGYYEKSGVLRDMFQNHMLQLLAVTAMEPPSRFEADIVRDEKVKVFRALRPFAAENLDEFLVLGQYASGVIDGQPVPAYREERAVAPESPTPTFALMKVLLDNWRWQGVPFYLISGKRLARKETEIAVQFKEVPHSMFRHTLGDSIQANRLTMGIYPEEKITLTFQTKNPGARFCLRTVTMDFHYRQKGLGPVLDAYEKVLIDCILGDQMLFWRQDGVERAWAFLTPLLNECENCDDRLRKLHFYPAGSTGPEAIDRLLETGG
jgi:glucose-6-phosphate 1-dehydrogenase